MNDHKLSIEDIITLYEENKEELVLKLPRILYEAELDLYKKRIVKTNKMIDLTESGLNVSKANLEITITGEGIAFTKASIKLRMIRTIQNLLLAKDF